MEPECGGVYGDCDSVSDVERGIVALIFVDDDVSFLLFLLFLRAGRVYVLAPLALTSPAVAKTTLEHINNGFSYTTAALSASGASTPKAQPEAKWTRPTEDERDRGVMIIVEVPGTPKQVTWHRKGDYFATVASDGELLLLIQSSTRFLMIGSSLPRSWKQIRLDSSTHEASNPGSIQKGERKRAESGFPSNEAAFLRSSEWISSR